MSWNWYRDRLRTPISCGIEVASERPKTSATLSASAGAILAMIIVWCTGSPSVAAARGGARGATTLWRRQGPAHRPQVQFGSRPRGGWGAPDGRTARSRAAVRTPGGPPTGRTPSAPEVYDPPTGGARPLPGYELADGS